MMTSKPAMSVIMSEYNTDPAVLKASILSILNQNFTDFEVIIVDDCGANDMKKVAESFGDARLRVVENSTNQGLALSLNTAVASAKADYVVRMDTDDIALPDRLSTLYEYIQRHPEYAVVGSLALEFSSTGDEGVLASRGEKTAHSLMRGDSLVHPSVIINKDAFLDVGGYKEYKRAEDLGLWCALVMKGYRLYVIDKVLLRYRVNDNDYKKRTLRNRTGEIKVRLEYYPKFNASPFDYLFIIKSIIAGILPHKFVRSYRRKFVLKRNGRL